ncbi:winged helix-turn-helix transcriptional regulator [Mycobacterium sp. NPDC050041]|uniref:winged helix-turn-helix transcriptional regulator n=1 Tax=Mycobacterium sp. NPDC050041 TaxID=3364293 RepID=UPI003C2C989C
MNAGTGRIRLLLCEPRHIYAAALARRLRALDFVVAVTYSDSAALEELRCGDPDVVLVSVGTDGARLANLDRLRQVAHVGVVALTDAEITPLLPHETVPVARDVGPIITRIRRALRYVDVGAESGQNNGALTLRSIGDLVVDMKAHRVHLSGSTLALTRTEFCILAALSTCPNEPLTWRQLEEIVWGTDAGGSRAALGVHVGKLRRKLGEDPSSPRYLHTVRGVGYFLGC